MRAHMEALALSLGIVPFLAGRTVLAVGLLVAFFAVQGVVQHGELGWKSVPLGIAAGFASLALQALVHWLRGLLRELTETFHEWMDRAYVLWVTMWALLFAAYAMGLLGKKAWEAVSALEPSAVALAGFPPEAWKLVLVGVVAWGFASLRVRLGALFSLLPVSEVGGLGRLLFLVEAGWTVLGLWVAVTFPWVGAALAVGALAALVAAVLVLRRVTEGGRGPCAACGKSLHLGASTCPACRTTRTPSKLGLLGRVVQGAPTDAAAHRLQLLTVHRCPTCAERLGADRRQPCLACGQPCFASEAESRAFVRHVDARVAALMPVFAALGLVPGLGLVLALLLYKLAPSGALGGYVRWHQALGTRLLRGAAMLALGLLQPVPLLGALAAAALIAVMQVWTRRAFLASPVVEAA